MPTRNRFSSGVFKPDDARSRHLDAGCRARALSADRIRKRYVGCTIRARRTVHHSMGSARDLGRPLGVLVVRLASELVNMIERSISDEPMSFEEVIAEATRIEHERPERERKQAVEDRTAMLAALAALPMEERIARIEAWIYDYKPQYVEPPRFR